MERIQRALEISRLQRSALAEQPAPEPAVDVRPKWAPPPTTDGVARHFPLDRAALRASRVVLPDDQSDAARAYRMLRAQVLQRVRDAGKRVFGVVSAVDG